MSCPVIAWFDCNYRTGWLRSAPTPGAFLRGEAEAANEIDITSSGP